MPSVHFDPDGHLIEVGESMEKVIRGLGRQGKPAEEVAAMTCMPVRAVLSGEPAFESGNN